MKREAIEIVGKFLRCDAPGCDHQETVAGFTEDLIGKRCPKCGADLLTCDDYQQGKLIEQISDALNNIIGPIEAENSSGILVSVNPHGSKTTIKVEKAERA